VPDSMREPVLGPLQSRCCVDFKLSDGALACESCRAGIAQMESGVAALGGLFTQVVAQIQKLITPPEVTLKRVRVAEFFTGSVPRDGIHGGPLARDGRGAGLDQVGRDRRRPARAGG
jgi:hypothetical protein